MVDGPIITGRRVIDLESVTGPVFRKERKLDYEVVIRKKDEISLSEPDADRLIKSAFEALRVGQLISREMDQRIEFQCDDHKSGYISSSYQVSRKMLNGSRDAQVAAIIHELIENYVETGGRLFKYEDIDTMPLMAEWLFTDETRFGYFRALTQDALSGGSEVAFPHHFRGWREAMQFLATELELKVDGTRPPEVWFSDLKRAREWSEDRKIEVIRRFLEKPST